MPYVKFLGFSFWVAWFGVAYGSSVWIQPTSDTSSAISVMFNVSTGSHMIMLVLAAVLSRRIGGFVRSGIVIFGAGLVATLGCVLVVASAPIYFPSWSMFICGSALTGIGTAGLSLNAGLLLCAVRPGEALRSILFAEVVASLLQFMVLGLPSAVALAVFIALPLLSSACFFLGTTAAAPRATLESSRLSPNAMFALFLVVVFVLSVTANLGKGVYNEMEGPLKLADDNSVVNLIVIICIICIAIASAMSKRSLNLGHWFYPMGVIIVSSLLITYLFPEEGSIGFVVSGAAYQIFDIIMWYVFSYVVYQSKVSAVFVVAAGRAVIAAGVTAGNLLGFACVSAGEGSGVLTAGIYVALFVGSMLTFLVFPERQIDRLLMPIPDEDEQVVSEGPEEGVVKAHEETLGDAAERERSARSSAETDAAGFSRSALPNTRPNAKPSLEASAEPSPARADLPQEAPQAAVVDVWAAAVEKLSDECGLTEREREVFALLSRGRGSQSISDALTISLYTTRAHTRNIYTKLDVHSRQELIDRVDARAKV